MDLHYNMYVSLEIWLAAVKKDGKALEFVREQTPEICLAAVNRNGYALVRQQTIG